MTRAVCCICLLFSGILSLSGQSEPELDKPRKAGRLAWFACTSIPDGLENPVKILGGESLTELELSKYMASEPVEIPKDGILRIVREVPDPEDSQKVKYLVLAEAKVPEGVQEALIILFPLTEPEGDLIFMSRVQSLAKFKGGDRLFINLSDTRIRVRFGGTIVNVAPRDANIFQPPNLDKPTNMPVMYEFYHTGHKKWRMLTASTVVLRPTRREIHIFNEGSRIGNIKKHKILFPVKAGD